MQNKLQLEVHMSSSRHKANNIQATAPKPVVDSYYPTQNNPQLFNFDSSYGYGSRTWSDAQLYNNVRNPPQLSASEIQQQQEMERHRQLVEQAKNELLARFPFYAINLQNNQNQSQVSDQLSFSTDDIPMPVEAPKPVEAPSNYEFHLSNSSFNY